LINWRLLKTQDSPHNPQSLGVNSPNPREFPSGSGVETKESLLLATMSLENGTELSHPQSRFSMRQSRTDYWYLIEGDAPSEALNARAVSVISRVSNKLTGKDFEQEILDVAAQVRRLIDQATSIENLCQCFVGWCPFW